MGSDQCLLFLLLLFSVPAQGTIEVPWIAHAFSSCHIFAYTVLSPQMLFPPHTPGNAFQSLTLGLYFCSLRSRSWLPQAAKDTLPLRPLCIFLMSSFAHFMLHCYQTCYFSSTSCCFLLHAFACTLKVPPSRIQIPSVFTWLTPSYHLSSAPEPSVPESSLEPLSWIKCPALKTELVKLKHFIIALQTTLNSWFLCFSFAKFEAPRRHSTYFYNLRSLWKGWVDNG